MQHLGPTIRISLFWLVAVISVTGCAASGGGSGGAAGGRAGGNGIGSGAARAWPERLGSAPARRGVQPRAALLRVRGGPGDRSGWDERYAGWCSWEQQPLWHDTFGLLGGRQDLRGRFSSGVRGRCRRLHDLASSAALLGGADVQPEHRHV